jgi:hypothetical protein
VDEPVEDHAEFEGFRHGFGGVESFDYGGGSVAVLLQGGPVAEIFLSLSAYILPHFRQLSVVDWQPQFVRQGIKGGFRSKLTSKQANCSIVRIVSIVCGLSSASLSRIIASL